ncbi:MAG: SWIM zinc finger family protein, partial [Nocardiopsaceae bacterium]|nr:SWIM zinc finger family protein [Nocardiopsaceae bacterium]
MSGDGSGAVGSGEPEFGRTWWGRAWVRALEQRAQLDPNRLPRGREYARSGAVGELAVAPGEARAQVQGRKTEPYRVRVRVRQFTDDQWDQVLTAISARLGHAAALLDGELPPEVADDVASTGLDLLPGGGEIGPRCDCPDDADPCKHSAAACYLVSDALDADPFVLLLLRGRSRDQVLAGVRSRRRGARHDDPLAPHPVVGQAQASGGAAVPDESPADGAPAGRAAEDAGVDARSAFAASARRAEVPVPPLPPARPGQPVALPVDPPA